ncbi:MAG: hypothetical protein HFH03_03895 [Dorea sp.]|nr:hypothetical protein [Dorea sp.]
MTSFIYIVLATAMFFLQDTYFKIGGVDFSLKNPCALAILFLALLNFTATVRLGRFLVLIRHTAVQMLPYLIPLFFSSIIWVTSATDAVTIANGLGMIVPQLLSVCMAAATLYLFGEKGILYCLGSMCAANTLLIVTVIAKGGPAAFLEEFRTLIVTFTAESGPLMMMLEVNDLTFAFGPFLIYLLLNRKKVPHFFLWLIVVTFLFLAGLKRIAIPAVILGVLIAFLLQKLPNKAARQTALCLSVGMMLVSFLYIAGIRMGLFEYLEAKLGINTMGRVNMFDNLAPYYDINFTFMGRGTGFERYVDWASGTVYQSPQRTIMQIHNDFMRMYLNIGFVGYWVWLCGYLTVRIRYWFRQAGKEAGCTFFAICIYCFVLYATDNTIYYPYTMLACALVPMSCNLNALADAELDKRSAHWSSQLNGEQQ